MERTAVPTAADGQRQAERAERIVAWLREQVREAGARGLVVGLSGGVDSSVTAVLAQRAFPDAVLGLIMPCHSNPADARDARRVADAFGIPAREVDLAPAYDALVSQLGTEAGPGRALALANLKPRLRMATLYYHANLLGYLVAGTGNRSELEVGYFTKYGDGGVDLLPLGGLVKAEVRQLARHLGVPADIVEKPPSAGLWEGQTDEGELGLPYEALDRYLLTGWAEPHVRQRIERMRGQSEHKRRLPPVGPV
jgi:NAD+ synthase